MLKLVLQDYENRETAVMRENDRLRATLYTLHTSLCESLPNSVKIPREKFAMPFDAVAKDLEADLLAACKALDELQVSETAKGYQQLLGTVQTLTEKNGTLYS